MSENGSWNKGSGSVPENSSDTYVPGQYSNDQQGSYQYDSNQYGSPQYSQQGNADYQYQSQPYQQQPAPYSSYNQYGQPGYVNGQKPAGHGLGIASLVLGIVAILTCWLLGLGTLAGIVGAILGIIALVKLGKTPGAKKGMAITGLVLSIIGTLLGAAFLLFTIFFGGLAMDGLQECGDLMNDQAAYEQCLDDWANNGIFSEEESGARNA